MPTLLIAPLLWRRVAVQRGLTVGLGLVLVGAFTAIALAWASEWGLGLPPCDLCYSQRHAYWAAMAFAALGLFVPGRSSAVLFGLAAVAVATSGIIGGFHAGVEWHWWQGPGSCTSTAMPDSLSDFNALFESDERITSCGEAPLRIFGLSMAGLNVLYALGLIMVSCAAAVFVSKRTGGQAHLAAQGTAS